MTTHRTLVPLLGLAAALGLVAGCTGSEEQPSGTGQTATAQPAPTSAGPTGTQTGASPTDEPDPTTAAADADEDAPVAEGSGCAPGTEDLPDGRWYGEVTQAGADTLEFDLMCFYIGEEANRAAQEDDEALVPVPNDYYVRNDNPALRTVPVGGGTTVVHYPGADPASPQTLGFADWASLVEDEDVFLLNVWLTVEDGEVSAVEEQWVP